MPAIDTEPRKGLILSVYRNAELGDCTNGGITATHTAVTVTGLSDGRRAGRSIPHPDPSMRVFPATERAPEVTLVIRDNGKGGHWVHLEPAHPSPEGTVGWMSGGNLAGAHDSRWAELTGGCDAVSVHDRTETAAQYAALSV